MPFLELEGEEPSTDNPRELEPEVTIGSGSQAGWRIPGKDLAARHFRINAKGDGATVIPASPQNVVVLNGRQVSSGGDELSPGDVVAAGSARFIYLATRDDPRPDQPAEAVEAHLVNAAEKKGYTLRRRVVQIGREVGCSIVLKDPTVSRFHADVRAEGGEYVLYSMGSAGTKVNGEPVKEPRLLSEGDVIQVGQSSFSFTKGQMPAGIRPVQFEDHNDDAFSRKSTQVYQRAVTSEAGRFDARTAGRVPKKKLVPLAIGAGVAAVALTLYLIWK